MEEEKKNQEIEEEKKEIEQEEVKKEPEKNDDTKKEKPEESKTKKENTENVTKKEKKKGKGKLIIIIMLIIAIIAGGGIGGYFYLNRDENKKESSKDEVEWGDVYIEILEDEDGKLEKMDDQKIQLLDLDKDEIPELIIYGIKNAKKHIANIYKINNKKKVDTIKVELDEDFDIKLLYNAKKEDYGWYAVSENKSSEKSNDQVTKVVYDLNIENEKYEPEKLDVNYDLDIVEVEKNYSPKVDFNPSASSKEKKEIFNKAKEDYVPVKEMITKEVEEKVEAIKVYKNVARIDKAKGLVYTALSHKDEWGSYEYPVINIDSSDVSIINSDIKTNYGFTAEDASQNLMGFWELSEISYDYNVKDKYLSLIVKKGGNDSVWASAYMIDLENSKHLSPEEILKINGLDKSEVTSKAREVAIKDFENQINKEKNAMGDYGWTGLGYDKEEAGWKTNLQNNVNKLENLYLNKDGDLILIVQYSHPGGQWSCTRSLGINITDNYSVKELTLNNGESSGREFEKVEEPKPTPTSTPTETQPESKTAPVSDSPNGVLYVKTTYSNIQFSSNPTMKIAEGTYNGPMGTLTIKNSSKGSFDFTLDCQYMTAAGYPNLGMLDGTAKETTNGNFAYVEKKANGDTFDYNVIFYISGGESNPTITVQDEYKDSWAPYCGHNVYFGGAYKK